MATTFKVELGKLARSKTTLLEGIVTSRSENLYGCKRYYLQQRVGEDKKVPEGCWFDEADLDVIGEGVGVDDSPQETGGPISKIR